MLFREVMRRTGLSRKQLRYLEERGLVGAVRRDDDRRVYSEEQVSAIGLIARLRELGVRLDEAAALAAEWRGERSDVPEERLNALMEQAHAENERRAQVFSDLAELKRRRRSSG